MSDEISYMLSGCHCTPSTKGCDGISIASITPSAVLPGNLQRFPHLLNYLMMKTVCVGKLSDNPVQPAASNSIHFMTDVLSRDACLHMVD